MNEFNYSFKSSFCTNDKNYHFVTPQKRSQLIETGPIENIRRRNSWRSCKHTSKIPAEKKSTGHCGKIHPSDLKNCSSDEISVFHNENE